MRPLLQIVVDPSTSLPQLLSLLITLVLVPELVQLELEGDVDYWITLNEPVGSYVGLGYLAGIWSPGFVLDGERAKMVLHNLIEAHVQAYDTISSLDNTDADGDSVPKLVGFSHAMTFVKPAKLSALGLPADNNEAARNFDYFTNDYFLNAVINGEEDLNYLDTLQRHDKSNTLHDIILPPKYSDCDYFGKPWGEYGITRDEVVNKINEDYNTHGFIDGDAFSKWLRNK
jgi:beta-glucosidase/6-phospho-beta-glucosidase/beta-galactosidase